MNGLGTKLLMIRKERGLSLRQVQTLVENIAHARGDALSRVTPSWLSRIERGHKISAKTLGLLEEAYRVSHDELIEDLAPQDEETEFPQSTFASIPESARTWLAAHEGPLLPPQSWGASFTVTTLLPSSLQRHHGNGCPTGQRVARGRGPLYGVIGTNDNTLFPFVRPGAVVEIDPALRSVNQAKTFQTIYERPIYFLRIHGRDALGALTESYACGWCELDPNAEWLTLVPSALTSVPHQRWRYRREAEVVGAVIRVCTRLGPLDIYKDRGAFTAAG